MSGADATDWAERNWQARASSREFAASGPVLRLFAMYICIAPMTSLMQLLLHVGSEQWEGQQTHEMAAGRRGKLRVVEATSGALFEQYLAWVQDLLRPDLLDEPSPWALMASKTLEASSIAFQCSHRFYQRLRPPSD